MTEQMTICFTTAPILFKSHTLHEALPQTVQLTATIIYPQQRELTITLKS